MTDRDSPPSRWSGRDPLTWLVAGSLVAWLLGSAAGQHPQRLLDRVRRLDPVGLLIPDWRFFAPEPARHDFRLLHRVLAADGEQTPWRETLPIAPRTWRQTIWFPDRRREKAMFDLSNELIVAGSRRGVDLTRVPAYRLLCQLVAGKVREEYIGRPLPSGFQFLVASHAGHDTGPAPDYPLTSAFIPLGDEGAG